MTREHPHVVVHPLSPSGGRRVTAGGEILGLVYDVRDLLEFLRRTGLEDAGELDLESSPLIEPPRGGGSDVWGPG
ncbi:hypothetical protein ACH4LK_22640 [Streptomyces lydicus]|uniref:hypothetical protein n=1 Tax=Streptomyces lydicus TaxID=47763 RepID=UPI0037AD6F4E